MSSSNMDLFLNGVGCQVEGDADLTTNNFNIKQKVENAVSNSSKSLLPCAEVLPMRVERIEPVPSLYEIIMLFDIDNEIDFDFNIDEEEEEDEVDVENIIQASAMAAQKRRGVNTAETAAGSSSQLSALSSTPGTLTDELAALFECPVCFEIVLPPIMQCQVGHLVCASCRPKLSCCPTCRGTLGNIRNLAMEKVANNLMFPCKHKSTGCRMSLGLNEKAEHEEVCEFRPYSCPCPGASCSWQGQLDKVMVHLQHSHKNITTLNGEDIVFLATEINLAGAVDWVMMQSCFGHHFMLVLEKQEKTDGHTQFFAIVQLIGSRKQAERFAYRLELNGNRRRLIWEAMPRSSHEGVASAIMSSDCLVFDNSIAQHFADNGNLGINVTISLVC
ncbi:E3 ubiquitin-protein ligase SIAH1A-like [Anthonomus grandis grandis]|uniref:E3 ubiquitin-protein ligase SIAH1A-like n=1 Tax=Anthonomus grandis grandis TaxID=2921223 RepID=UPI0021665D72|nr:E3 ubiquitin-protein ligase SIAH1A-like [Anthonomus grandis grandis]